jgi:hypothetical protein
MATAATQILLFPVAGAHRAALVTAGEDCSESANATSLADWNRSSRPFSRQCRTMFSSASGTFRPDSDSAGGSSFRIAAIVSLAVCFLNVPLPESSS